MIADVKNQASSGAKPAAPDQSVWDKVESMPEFRQLLSQKAKFVIPMTIFFVVYYFILPVSVGYFPAFMDQKVLGPVNLAYLFALSQFFVAWAIAWAYVRAARGFDETANRIVEKLGSGEKTK